MHSPPPPWLLQEGHALFLHAAASPGMLGALRDYLRVGFGTRMLLTSIIGVLLHQPPMVLLLQQIAVMLLVRADYCRCAWCHTGSMAGALHVQCGIMIIQRIAYNTHQPARVLSLPALLRSCSIFQEPVSKARMAAAWNVLELGSMFVQPWGPASAGGHHVPGCWMLYHMPPGAPINAVVVGGSRPHANANCAPSEAHAPLTACTPSCPPCRPAARPTPAVCGSADIQQARCRHAAANAVGSVLRAEIHVGRHCSCAANRSAPARTSTACTAASSAQQAAAQAVWPGSLHPAVWAADGCIAEKRLHAPGPPPRCRVPGGMGCAGQPVGGGRGLDAGLTQMVILQL